MKHEKEVIYMIRVVKTLILTLLSEIKKIESLLSKRK